MRTSRSFSSRSLAYAGSGLALCVLAAPSQAQMRFSIDWNGPTVSTLECGTGTPITEGDILMPCGGVPMPGPLPPPRISIPGGAGGLGLALHPGCVGHAPGTPCGVEVDALSFGVDALITQAGFFPGRLWWSTDEYSGGIAGSPVPPNVPSEFPCGDASADLMLKTNFMPPVPNPPFIVPPDHRGVIDGDGLASCTASYPGLGLREPNLPSFAPLSPGDNLDAYDDHTATSPPGRPYFSLDAGFTDPCSGVPNSGSALAHGFRPGDILSVTGAGLPFVWAPALGLGLDFFGTATDDLDALAMFEDGDGVFDPFAGPYGWGPGTGDMVLFSVRRGSAVIGMPDSFMGIPIEPGDILMPPIPGGASPFPAIFVSAENLGLGCVRTGTVSGPCTAFGDELDALDSRTGTFADCNGNNVEDAIDIAVGTSLDTDLDGIPDECELLVTPYCFCPNGGVCLNPYVPGGCQNSTGVGSILVASGSSSWAADDLVLTATQVPVGQPGIIYRGSLAIGPIPFGDGLRCVGGRVVRFPVSFADGSGTYGVGPGIVAGSFSTSCPIALGDTWFFQAWYRNPGGPCGTGFNLSNALQVTFF